MLRRLSLTLAVVALAATPLALAGSKDVLTGKLSTDHFDVRYRPGTRAGAAVERDAAMTERDFADICSKLAFTPEGRFSLWLYDDVADLQEITGKKGVGGYTAARETHIPHGNDQTRYHELVHLIAARLPKTGKESRSMFFVEGLANALLEHVHGINVHAVAKFYRDRKELPALETFLGGGFYAWQRSHPNFDAYDVAGSFVRFLIDTYGIENVKRYYTGTPAKTAMGVDEKALEKTWHQALDGYTLRPEVETLLRQRHGEDVRFEGEGEIPPEILGKPSDWKSLLKEKLRPRDGANWAREGQAIVGVFQGSGWHVCDLGTKKYRDCAVRARIRTREIYGGVQLQLGDGCSAMIVGNGTFVYRHEGGVPSPRRKIEPNGAFDLLMVRRGGKLRVWVDSVEIVEGPVDKDPMPVGIGFHCGQNRGSAWFTDVRVRELR